MSSDMVKLKIGAAILLVFSAFVGNVKCDFEDPPLTVDDENENVSLTGLLLSINENYFGPIGTFHVTGKCASLRL